MKLFLEISSIGSACKKNRYEPFERTLLTSVGRHNSDMAKKFLIDNGFVVISNNDIVCCDKTIKEIYNTESKNVCNPDEFNEIERKTIEKLKTAVPNITDKDITQAKMYLQETLKKDCGKNVEKITINTKKYERGNSRMYYFSINDDNKIGGFHDATDNNTVIEIKTRMKRENIRKNKYDLYQLFGYILALNVVKGKIVQVFNGVTYDSDIETENEYGLIDITELKWKTELELMLSELHNYFYILKDILNGNNINTLLNCIPNSDKPIAIIDNGILKKSNQKYIKLLKVFMT